MKRAILLWLLGCLLLPTAARSQAPSPHAIDIPPWFAETFLDFREDVRDAAKAKKRLLVYFGQDGCPYCKELMQTNFTQARIVKKTRERFTAVALNLWGDREVTWLDGKTYSEKEFARLLDVQFTPTVLFFNEKGEIVVRLNGYYPPHRFEAVLDYVSGRREKMESLADYMARAVKESASATLHQQPFFVRTADLSRRSPARPLAVLFETRYCSGCDEMHREGFGRAEVKELLARFDVVRFSLSERTEITTPDGRRMPAERWARELKVAYTPTIAFFGEGGREVFRIEAYLRPFHLASSFDYVASGAYRGEPSFQRFVQARAERMRALGQSVDLWK